MREKKAPPLPTKELTKQLEDRKRVQAAARDQSIMQLLMASSRLCDLETPVFPEQLADVVGMFFTLMHLQRVTDEFWCQHFDAAARLLELSQFVIAEDTLSKIPGLGSEAQATLKSAIDLSINEINTLRVKLGEVVQELGRIPPDYIARH